MDPALWTDQQAGLAFWVYIATVLSLMIILQRKPACPSRPRRTSISMSEWKALAAVSQRPVHDAESASSSRMVPALWLGQSTVTTATIKLAYGQVQKKKG